MNSPIKRTLLAAMIAGLGASGAALAAPPAFEDIDANGDGMVSASEASAVEGLDLTSADTNGDGALSRTEYEAVAGKAQ
jgi:hypothetical protein